MFCSSDSVSLLDAFAACWQQKTKNSKMMESGFHFGFMRRKLKQINYSHQHLKNYWVYSHGPCIYLLLKSRLSNVLLTTMIFPYLRVSSVCREVFFPWHLLGCVEPKKWRLRFRAIMEEMLEFQARMCWTPRGYSNSLLQIGTHDTIAARGPWCTMGRTSPMVAKTRVSPAVYPRQLLTLHLGCEL